MPKIKRDGLGIHYEVVGEGRTILLLHGFLFSTEMWAKQVGELSRHYRVISVDFRGHGRSSRVTKPFTLYDLVSDVVAVLDRCDEEKAVWIGLSMGGMVAMRAAIVVPEAVEAMVLLDTSSEREPRMSRFRYRAMANGARFFGLKRFVPSVSKILFGSTSRREQPVMVDRWKEKLSALDLRSVRHGLEALVRRDSVTPLLHEIDVPTLVLVGGEDQATPPVFSKKLAEGVSGARLEVIPGAGHMSPLERPKRVLDLIVEFLRSSAEIELEEEKDDTELEEAPAEAKEEDLLEAAEPEPEVEPEVEMAEVEETASAEDGPGPAEAVAASASELDPRLEEPAAEEGAGVSLEEALGELDLYTPDEDDQEDHEIVLPGGKRGSERRRKRRVSPSRKLYGRVGHVGVLLVDVSESGARVEHYNRRFQTGSTITLEIEWESRAFRAECQVMSSRVHRFIPGDKGATVYQSGVLFRRMNDESKEVLKELVNRLVTRGLAEQVANARGIGPVLQRDMPTFRSGVVNAGGRPKEAGSEGPSRLIRENPLTDQIGFIRCRKLGARWERKWTLDPEQPRDGFTILASENKLEIDMLCETWDSGDESAKRFIRDCARMSIETALAEGEPS